MNLIIVTAGLITYGKKILIAKRFIRESNEFKWEFPGGKLEMDETIKECLSREIKEELDLEIIVGEIFEVVYHRNGDRNILLLCYKCQGVTNQARNLECYDHRWIDFNDIYNYDFMDADKIIVDKVFKKGEQLFE